MVFLLAGCIGSVKGSLQSLVQSSIGLSFEQPFVQTLPNRTIQLAGKDGVAPYTFELLSGPGSLDSASGVFQSNQVGISVVRIVDKVGKWAYGTVQTLEPVQIISNYSEISAGNMLMLSAKGGKEPYKFSSSKGSISADGVFTGPSEVGTVAITVEDSLGSVSSTEISIKPPLNFANTSVDVTAGQSVSLAVVNNSAIGKVVYSILAGEGSIDPLTGQYTSSSSNGTTIVQAIDELGNKAIEVVKTTGGSAGPLTLSPLNAMAAPSGKSYFSISGGAGNYSFDVISGGATFRYLDADNGNSAVEVTAPDFATSVIVKASDSAGASTTGMILVAAPLLTNPKSLSLAIGGQVTVIVSGGIGPYQFTVTQGKIDSATGAYQAPLVPGLASIKVVDQSGQMLFIPVSVKQGLLVSPADFSMPVLSGATLTAIGGVPPYEFTIKSGEGQIKKNEDGLSAVFMANEVLGITVVEVQDSTQDKVTSQIQTVGDFRVEPYSAVTTVGKTLVFNIEGGTAPYTVSFGSSSAKGSLTQSAENTFQYSSPLTLDAASIESIVVQDAKNQVTTASVIVNPPMSYSGVNSNLVLGQSQVLRLQGGVLPFEVTSSNSTVVTVVRLDNERFEVTAVGTGTALLNIQDGTLTSSSQSINVSSVLSVSPQIVAVGAGEAKSFTFTGGVRPLQSAAMRFGRGSLSLFSESGVTFTAPTNASASGETSVMRVLDGGGNYFDVQITSKGSGGGGGSSGGVDTGLPFAGPAQPVKLAVFNSKNLSSLVSGGTTPYSYTISGASLGGSVGASSGAYLAGSIAGTETVKVRDTAGAEIYISVQIAPALQISPTGTSLMAGKAKQFSATGGVIPYTFEVVSSGGGSIGLTTGSYVAPSIAGTYQVKAVDDLGNESTTSVVVTPGPSRVHLSSINATSANQCSAGIKLSLRDENGAPIIDSVQHVVSFTLGTLNPLLYAENDCSGTPINQVTLPADAEFVELFFKSSKAETFALSAASAGLVSATQLYAVVSGAATQLFATNLANTLLLNSCTAMTIYLKDSYGNFVTPADPVVVTPTLTKLSLHSLVDCSDTAINSLSISSASGSLFYVKAHTLGAATLQLASGGLTGISVNTMIQSLPPVSLAFTQDPSVSAIGDTVFAQQPIVQARDSGGGLVPDFAGAITMAAFSDSACTISAAGNLMANANPLNAINGVATFSGLLYQGDGVVYLQANSATATTPCFGPINITPNYNSSIVASPQYAPSDGNGVVPIRVVPRLSGLNLGAGQVVQLRSSRVDLVHSTGTACSGHRCAQDLGNGSYLFLLKAPAGVVGTSNFDLFLSPGTAQEAQIGSFAINFDSANFSVFATSTTVTSSDFGKNIYITGGNITFNATTVGGNFGDIIINAGTILPSASTTTSYTPLDFTVRSLTMNGGTINTTGYGYYINRSYSSSGIYNAGAFGNSYGGSHIGLGGPHTNGILPPAFDNLKDPKFPGGGGSTSKVSWVIGDGGGVIKIVSQNDCYINGSGNLQANGTAGGAAGGSINLKCKGFIGTPAANGLSAYGSGAGAGASGWDYMGAGGGGAIALTATGGVESFSQGFKYPTTMAEVATLKTYLRAYGGASSLQVSGASWPNGWGASPGSIFLKHSNLPNGSLIIENNNNHFLAKVQYVSYPSFTATVAQVLDNRNLVLTLDAPLASHLGDSYKGLSVRFIDSKFNNNTPDDASDDFIATIVSHTPNNFQFDRDLNGVTPGDRLRVVYVFDHFDIGSGAMLKPEFDLIVKLGSFNRSDKKVDITNAFVCESTNGSFNPAVNSMSFTTGTYNLDGRNCNVRDVGYLLVEGGTISEVQSVNATTANFTGGNTEIYNLTTASHLTMSNTAIFNGNNMNIGGNFNMSAGTLKQIPTTSTTIHRLSLNVAGDFTMSGGAIDLTSLGYPNYYSFGDLVPSMGLQGNLNNGPGGSHFGRGGFMNAYSSGPTYDKFWDPNFPGTGGPTSYNCQSWVNGIGGGVLRVNGTGACSITGASTIKANGGIGGAAGGSINLKCASFSGTLAAGAITANGGNGAQNASNCDNMAAGGGGGIAIVSTGGASSMQGSFKYPTTAVELTATKSVFNAFGGNPMATNGGGGAGTIYLKHSGLDYGSLIVDNGTKASMPVNTRQTEIPSFAATITSTLNANTLGLSFAVPLTANHNNIYKGILVRVPDDFENGTPTDFTDDQILEVDSHSPTAFTFSSTLPAVANGKTVRSLIFLDHLEVSGGSVLISEGDIIVKSGNFTSSNGSLNLTNGLVQTNGNATLLPQVELLRITNAFFFSAVTNTGVLNNVKDVSYEGGTTYLDSLNLRSFSISGGTLNVREISTTADFTVSGTGVLNVENVNVGGNFSMLAGTVKHPATTSTELNRLFIDVAGNFSMTGGSMDVSALGYLNKESFGDTVPSTALGSTGNTAAYGGSHFGQGGGDTNGAAGLTFDDYKNPQYPGGGAGVNNCYYGTSPGGGVVNIKATGTCSLSGTATLKADGGGMGGSGGSISVQCYSIGGTLASAAVTALGDNGVAGGSGCDHVGSGGGGGLAFVASGPAGSLTGSFAVPTNSTEMNNFRDKFRAFGGVGVNTGGAGTIFLKHGGMNHGALIVDNNNLAITAKIGLTKMRGSSANSNLVNAKLSDNSIGMGNSNPFANMVNYFVGLTVHVFDSSDLDPLSNAHLSAPITGNSTGALISAPSGFASLGPVADDKEYRFVHRLDSIYVDRNATLDLNGGDLIVDPANDQSCDFINSRSGGALGYLSIPAAGKIIGRHYSSIKCPPNNVSTKGTSLQFLQYCDGLGTCAP